MGMHPAEHKSNRTNISITAYRTIYILQLLAQQPHSIKALNTKFKKNPSINKELSSDTIGIYIQTLREIGFNITRPSKKNGYQYELIDHCLKIHITKEELEAIYNAKQYFVNLDKWDTIFNLQKLLTVLEKNIADSSKELWKRYKNILFKRDINYEQQTKHIISLKKYCQNNQPAINIIYKSLNNKVKVINFFPEKITYENDALYLWGIDLADESYKYLRVDRMSSIRDVKLHTNISISVPIDIVEFKIFKKLVPEYKIQKDESILEETQDYYHIQAIVKNQFYMIQKLVSFGSACQIITPNTYKKALAEKYKEILSVY